MSVADTSAAPTGRKKTAQGKDAAPAADVALGHDSKNTSSPEGAKEGGELPHGWTHLAMGEVGRWFGGGTPSKANPRFWTGGKIPWVSPKDMKCDLITDAQDHITEDAVAQSATNLVEAGSILIVVRSGILQHTLPVAVAQRQVALNQDLKAVKPLENIRSDYLALALKAFERDILHTCTKTGTTVQSLELPVFLRFQIPVAPLPEQRRIVAEIEKQFTRLEAGVTALRRVQANLKRYRAAVLKAACEGRLVPTEAALARSSRSTKNGPPSYETGEALLARILTERRNNLQGRGKYEEPKVANTSELPPLTESWAWATVEQLLRNDSGLGYGILKPGNEDPNGVPMVRVMDIGDGKLSGTEIVKVEPKLSEEFNRTVLESGDILLAVMATVGRCTVVPEHLVGANVNRALAVIKPTGLVPSKFLELALRSPRLQQLFQKNKIGSAQARINLSDLRTYCLPLPPLAEQTRIVAEVERRLSVVEELESVVSANLQRATRLRQSILQRAFTGELT
jgi:type I restriction enzyme S subunit